MHYSRAQPQQGASYRYFLGEFCLDVGCFVRRENLSCSGPFELCSGGPGAVVGRTFQADVIDDPVSLSCTVYMVSSYCTRKSRPSVGCLKRFMREESLFKRAFSLCGRFAPFLSFPECAERSRRPLLHNSDLAILILPHS